MTELPHHVHPVGARLEVLRDLKGLTQEQLAVAAGVSQGFLSRVQNGTRPLPRSMAAELCGVYSLPLTFFQIANPETATGQFTFRKKARASARDERRVKRLYSEASRLFAHVSSKSGYHTSNLPDPGDYNDDPEECAEALRSSAGLSAEEPVKNVTRLLERHGIGVITNLDESLGEVTDHVGISRPTKHSDRPLVALVSDLPGAVQRLSLGHEAGHWVFDRSLAKPLVSTRCPEEARAFRFGGALLLPESVVRKRVTESMSLQGYLRVKADYGISVGAICRRAKDLGVISPARYRSLSIQLASQGWRNDEPVAVAEETPRLMSQAMQRIYGHRYVSRASDAHGIEQTLIRRWTRTVKADGEKANIDNVVSVSFGGE